MNTQIESLIAQDAARLAVDLNPEIEPSAAFGTAYAALLRANEARSKLRKGKLVPVKISIDCEVIELTPDEQHCLSRAGLTHFRDGPPFSSPDEVKAYFRGSNLRQLLGSAMPTIDDEALAVMGAAVIKSRTHCQF